MKPLFLTFSPPGWPPSSALRSTSKGLISVESGAEGIIDHTESLSLHIYCFCTEGTAVLWSQKPWFQSGDSGWKIQYMGSFGVCFFSLNGNGTYYDVISCKYVWLLDYKIAQLS